MDSPAELPAPPPDSGGFSDVRKVGYLRKPKSMHKRFFVLRAGSAAGPARLEYYENEKKWRHKAAAPKRCIRLETCLNINKRQDAKHKHLLALYTRDECFSLAADSPQEQEGWYRSLLHELPGQPASEEPEPRGPAFREVWQVILKPKGLGQSKNLTGVYRLCLGPRTLSLLKLNAEAAAVVLQLMNIRRCGHSESFFFMEVGRSAVTGPGEFWMQVDDAVVAQSMHETILEAMKAMSEEFRPRSKSQGAAKHCSNPISVPLRRPQHPGHPPPSQVGLTRRTRTDSATSPGQPKPGACFRLRASSDGEGSAPCSRPASVDGSPVSPGRAHSSASQRQQQHRGSSRLHPPLNHSRSIPLPSCRCSPSATSPASLSSSSTSGHGSTSDCLYPRRSSASGSPSDGGFISSDEYGSSPCDFRSSFRSVTPDSLGRCTPPAREDDLSYICMGRRGLPPQRATPEDTDQAFRKGTRSAGTSCSPPPAPEDDYTEMMPSYRLSSYRHSAFVPTHCYPEEGLELHLPGPQHMDDGYMPMSPGVAPLPSKSGDYMPMSPKSVSAPQQIINPRRHLPQTDPNGYMMMSPSGSCSPEGYGKIWTNGANPKLSVESGDGKLPCGGDYINMSPASGSTTSTPPDCYLPPADEAPRPLCSYFSLPRSFKHVHRRGEGSPRHTALFHPEDSSSSTSSDSLGGQETPSKPDTPAQARLPRPTRLSLDKASTLPRVREPPEPKSPDEYVNIDFNSSTSLCTPPYIQSRIIPQRENLSEYINMDLGSGSCKPSAVIPGHPTRQCSIPGLPDPPDYMSMQLGAACADYVEVPPAPMMQTNYPEIPSASRMHSIGNYAEIPAESSLQNNYADISPASRMQSTTNYEMTPASRMQSNKHYTEISAEPRRQSTSNYAELLSPTMAQSINLAEIPSESRVQNNNCVAKPLVSRVQSNNCADIPAKSRMQNNSNYVERPPVSRMQKAATHTFVKPSNSDYADIPANGHSNYVEASRICSTDVHSARANSSRNYAELPVRILNSNYSEALQAPRPHSIYADMTCGRVVEKALLSNPLPPQDLAGPTAPSSLLLGQGSGLSAFTRVSLSPGHSTRVIRADPQGRRRHSSETFSSTPSAARGSAPLPCAEDGKRHSSASFENVSLKPGESAAPDSRNELQPGYLNNGLNYIDLDLGKDASSQEQASHCSRLPNQLSMTNSSDDLSPYARITFLKPEDLRSASAKEE